MPDKERPDRAEIQLMNIWDAARYLGTAPATLYTKVWRREIPFVKFGRSVRFDVKDLDALIEWSKVKPDALNSCWRLR